MRRQAYSWEGVSEAATGDCVILADGCAKRGRLRGGCGICPKGLKWLSVDCLHGGCLLSYCAVALVALPAKGGGGGGGKPPGKKGGGGKPPAKKGGGGGGGGGTLLLKGPCPVNQCESECLPSSGPGCASASGGAPPGAFDSGRLPVKKPDWLRLGNCPVAGRCWWRCAFP
jgi:hypothetical protein